MALLAAALVAAALPGVADAAPEEIQVYMDELNAPGDVGLDVHVNNVISGTPATDYPGQQPSLHQWRVTPEFALGVTSDLEAGLYLPLATIDREGQAGAYGVKARVKYIAHHRDDERWWYGLNLEIGRVSRQLDVNPWNGELKGIVGARLGRWTLAYNLNADFVVSGPRPSPLSFDGDTKVSYALAPTLSVGVESYNGLGDTRHLGRFGSADQTLFGTIDTAVGKWDLNLGIGRGYGTNPDHLIVKAIVGVPVNGLFPHHRAGAMGG